MLTVFHGDNLEKSRAALQHFISAEKQLGKTVEFVAGKTLTVAELEQVLGSQSLFGERPVIVIESLHAQTSKKRLAEILKKISEFQADSTASTLVIWEAKTLTATQCKALPQHKLNVFPLSKHLFTWLGAIKPGSKYVQAMIQSFHKTVETEDPMMCLAMAARQIRMLITAKETHQGNPRLISQAAAFDISQLARALEQLAQIDYLVKTGKNHSDLETELDLWMLGL